MQEGIVFEPSAPYSQEQNGVSEQTGRTIMDMARATIIEGDLDDIFWPEVVLAMTYTKNVRPTTALEGGNPYEKQFNCPPDVSHLRILGSTVYVLIHEEERDLKSEKFTPRALKGKLVGYDGHTIYKVHIEEQQKVIRVKDLRVFEDTVAGDTNLPTFDGKPTFEGFLATDNDDDQSIRPSTSKEIAPTQTKEPTTSRSGRKVKPTVKVLDNNSTKNSLLHSRRKVELAKETSNAGDNPAIPASTLSQSTETQALIAQLTSLLEEDWESKQRVSTVSTDKSDGSQKLVEVYDEDDPLRILATKLMKANAGDPGDFAFATQFDVEELETYERAMSGPHSQQWAQAMKEELDQLHKNETWTLVDKETVEPDHKPLGGKWVYKVKRDVDGNIARFKARWVVKGYLQQYGVDFDQTYAAVVKPMAFRVLFAIVAFFDLDIDQMDVKTAFLYGLIDQLIYVEIPKGSEDQTNKGKVCKLLKALYGLKQSPRLWYERLASFLLEKLGLKRINADHSIFVTSQGLNGPIVSTFVDDIKIMGVKGSRVIDRVKAELTYAFEMVDMGQISFYLGLKVERDRQRRIIKLSQPAYIEKVLQKFHLHQANSCTTPMVEAAELTPSPDEIEASQANREKYQAMTGSLMFSMVETRPDIAFSTSVASRFAKNPGHIHTEAVKRILKYLKGTKERGIVYGGGGADIDNLTIEGYSDSDWAGDKSSRRSTSGFIFMLNGGPVSWCSKRQATVALSSTEAEYIALTLAAKEATWLRLLLTELGLLTADSQHAKINVSSTNTSAQALEADAQAVKSREKEDLPAMTREGENIGPDLVGTSDVEQSKTALKDLSDLLSTNHPKGQPAIPLKGDNQGSIALAHNPVFHARTKHIDIQHHYIRDEVAAGRINLTYVPTSEMIADGLTKALTHAKFHDFIDQMRMS